MKRKTWGKDLSYEALVASQDRLYRTKSVVSPWVVQFSFKLYSLMLTSEIMAILAMIWFRPRAWCTFCPMGTLTQGICKFRNRKG
jgi:hypothetical protein